MKLLIVLSASDFDNFTRRATVEAICHQNPDTTLLFFTGIKGLPIRPPSDKSLRWRHYCTLGTGKGEKYLRSAEVALAGLFWRPFFKSFDTIFLTDPNQELLLNYIGDNQKLIYLIRDPNALMSKKNFRREERILSRNPHVFAVSKALCTHYPETYYPHIKLDKVTYWPNTVDLKIWDFEKSKEFANPTDQTVIGLSGNITDWLDFDLLMYIAQKNPDFIFKIYGRNELKDSALDEFNKAISQPNVTYYGWVPFENMPKIVSEWSVGIVIGRKDASYSTYWGNNKIYQYTAMGKPFVAYSHNTEYDKFGDAAFLAKDREEFSQKLREAAIKSKEHLFKKYCVEKAYENSSEVRARQFLQAIQ